MYGKSGPGAVACLIRAGADIGAAETQLAIRARTLDPMATRGLAHPARCTVGRAELEGRV